MPDRVQFMGVVRNLPAEFEQTFDPGRTGQATRDAIADGQDRPAFAFGRLAHSPWQVPPGVPP
jgi:hypothetical protein